MHLGRGIGAGTNHHLVRDPERHRRVMEVAHHRQILFVAGMFVVLGLVALVIAVVNRAWIAVIGAVMMLSSVVAIHFAESVRGVPVASARRRRNLREVAWWVLAIGLFVGGVIVQGIGHAVDAGAV